MHPTKPDGPRTLWGELRNLFAFELANGGQVSIVNRLDRETSGLVLVAKTATAARRFGLLMQQQRIAKEYLAIVWGWPEWDQTLADFPLARQGEHGPSAISFEAMREFVRRNGADGAAGRATLSPAEHGRRPLQFGSSAYRSPGGRANFACTCAHSVIRSLSRHRFTDPMSVATGVHEYRLDAQSRGAVAFAAPRPACRATSIADQAESALAARFAETGSSPRAIRLNSRRYSAMSRLHISEANHFPTEIVFRRQGQPAKLFILLQVPCMFVSAFGM